MSKAKGSVKQVLTPEAIREEMRRRIMCRWKDKTKVTTATIELVRWACADGCTVVNICSVLGIHEKTFYKWMDTYPQFAEAVKGGRQIEHDRLVNAMFQAAIGGNVAAGCFLLKSRHNYQDKGDGNAAAPNKLSITQNNTINFTLPRALTMEEYMRKLAATTEAISPSDAERMLAEPGMKAKVIRQLTMERSEEANHEHA